MATAEVPNRSLFKAPEVCEIAQVQPYVLRSWEAEFPDLGVARGGVSGRVYRRHDVERVLRLKHLLFVEGLTLAGARRRLEEERTPLPSLEEDAASASPVQTHSGGGNDQALRRRLSDVQQGLRSLLEMLGKHPSDHGSFELHAPPAAQEPRPETKGERPGNRTTRSAAKSHKPTAKRGRR